MAHGFVRATADTETRLARALSFGGNPRFETRLGRLHIVQSPAGAPSYDDLANRAEMVKLDDLQLRICSYSDLVAMKEATARDQDRLDLAALREARDENG